ncbi:MAG: hypothetical protein EXS39_06080 [Opitutaceae bacterium]|nr:hypothetical protein [Opitutaceae bacterium]
MLTIPLPCAVAALLMVAAVIGSNAGELTLPPLTGELAGDFTPLTLAGAPRLHWTLTLQSPAPAARTAQLVISGLETAGRLEARFDATGAGTWRLLDGRVGLKPWLNGQLTVGEIALAGEGTLRGSALAGTVTLEVHGVDLNELLKFADADRKYVRAAEGRVEGSILVHLVAGAPASFEGGLRLVKGTTGVISLQPTPGLLSNYVPEPVRKLYPGIEAIEQGLTPLEASVLRLTLHPAGDAQGRSAVLRIEGRPRDPKFIAPLELDVNIAGPVENLMRKVLDSRLKIGK